MKRLVLVAALAGALSTVAILSASGSAQTTGERTFTLIEKNSEGTFNFVNNPPRGERPPFEGGQVSAGDVFVFHQPVRNQAGRRVGANGVECTAARGGRSFNKAQFVCHGAYSLKHGAITVEAPFEGGSRVVNIAITGGTGAYEGASGSIKSTQGRHRTVEVVHLLG